MKKLALVSALAFSTGALAQQSQPQTNPEAVTRALYERYQRADTEAVNLRAQVMSLEKEVADLKKAAEAAKPKAPEK